MRTPAASLPLPSSPSPWSSGSPSSPTMPEQSPFLALKGYILHRPKRLQFIRFLGAGAFGGVYLAEDLDWVAESVLPPPSALKKPPRCETGSRLPPPPPIVTSRSPQPQLRPPSPRYYAVKCIDNRVVPYNQILREVNNHRAVLGHRGVLDLYGCAQQDNWSFFILEYAEGGDMFQCMLETNMYSGDDGRIGHVFRQIVDAVRHCHRRSVFHRDLKPGE